MFFLKYIRNITKGFTVRDQLQKLHLNESRKENRKAKSLEIPE
jgi:hypothetical protein